MSYCYATFVREAAELHNQKIYSVKVDGEVIGGLGAGKSIEQSLRDGSHNLAFFVDGEMRQSIDFRITPDRTRVTVHVRYNERTGNIDVNFDWGSGGQSSPSAAASSAPAKKPGPKKEKKDAGPCVIALLFGIAALVLSRFSLAAIILAIPAIIYAVVCLAQSRKTFGLAVAGLILGIGACYFTVTAYLDFQKSGEEIPLFYNLSDTSDTGDSVSDGRK